VTPKIAIGVTHQTVSIDGNQRLGLPSGGPPLIFAGGLLATPSNIGSFEADRFSVVPELTLTAGCYLTGNLRAFVGYNALYWSNVVRPGRQIDRIIDLTTVPNSFFPGDPTLPNRPGVFFTQSDLWVHGINFGMEYRW
jgi:hypothetical protein